MTPRSTVSVRATRTRAKSRNSDSSRDRRSDSRITRPAERLVIVGDGGHARDLLDRAANRRERILDFVRERRAQFRDALESLGAQPQDVEALLIGDVLEDRRRRASAAVVVVLGVRRRDADGKTTRRVGDDQLSARRADLRLGGLANGVRQLGRDASDHVEDRFADSIGELDAEQLLGHRVGVEQSSGDVDRDDAAADVAEDVFGLEARPLERGDELVGALSRRAQFGAEIANDQRDDRDDA